LDELQAAALVDFAKLEPSVINFTIQKFHAA